MTAGMMLLTIGAVLVYCGLMQRVLDRMALTDRQALLLIALMLVGTFLPALNLGAVSVSFGGAVIPLGVCAYLLLRCTSAERWRTLLGVVLTGGAVYALSALLPSEPERLPVDPMWLYGLCGGVIAWLTGRSRRGALICGVGGVVLADIVSAVVAWAQGSAFGLVLGGAGIADATVISGVIGVLICEAVGEAAERIVRLRQKGRDAS